MVLKTITSEKILKNGPSKICGRQPLKNLKEYGLLPFNFFKGCLPQILFGPFLYTLSHMCFVFFNIRSSGTFVLFIYSILVRLWTSAESHLATMVMLYMAVSETFIDNIPFNFCIAYSYKTYLQLATKV